MVVSAPYLRIVEELRRRIVEGEFGAGEAVPSTRQIVREWGVAMATATKVLAALREEGLVRVVPGVGTVVTDPLRARRTGDELTRQRIVRVAMRVADREGLAAVSMRRLAAELDSSAMSLYRHLAGKEELVQLMADAAYGEEPLPAERPPGWRAQVELSLRLQWRVHRRHPWMAQAVSLSRPQFIANGMAHFDWLLRAVDGLGLDARTMLHVGMSLAQFVGGAAAALQSETQALADTGITDDEWMRGRSRDLGLMLSSGSFPTLARVLTQPGVEVDLDSVFEFGLMRQLDGLAVLVGRAIR